MQPSREILFHRFETRGRYRVGDQLGAWSYGGLGPNGLGLSLNVISWFAVPSPPVGACSVSGLRVSNTHSLWLSTGKSRKSRLRLDENAKERTARRRFRTEIAHETIFRPNLDVTGCAIRIINQD